MQRIFFTLAFVGLLSADAQWKTPGSMLGRNQYSGNRHNGLMMHPRRPSLSAGWQLGIPAGDFARVYDGVPVGFGGGFYVNLRQTPFDLGITGAWRRAGTEKDRIILYTGDDLLGNPVFAGGSVKVSNTQHDLQGAIRFRPLGGRFQLYGELLSGVKSFSTTTLIEADAEGFSNVNSNGKALQSTSLAYGWATGAKYMFARGLMAEVRLQHMTGGTDNLVDLGTVSVSPAGNATFDTFPSKTEMYLLRFGISLEF